ncbi:MAG: LysE family translocator [Deltaproteobacteria bacterium]|nr:LysE family translocator [Deltaproteobacteria bacterium]MBW2741993.1 LysE family translocator [Deltaproteobacteria bacterium]
MPGIDALITFAVALFFLELSPGPDMMLVIGRGIGQGRKIALLTVVGSVFVSGAVQLALLILGVASLLQAHPLALDALRWVGAVYLFWYGVQLLKSFHQENYEGDMGPTVSSWSAIRDGTINNLTNPKSFLFMFAFLPQFVDPVAGPVWLQLLVLGSLQKFAGVFSLGSVAIASGMIGNWINQWSSILAWQQRFTGVVMIGLAVRLVLTGNANASPAPRLN